mmetsp:Transcript_23542/g.65268  ORF Transcript_23542/g.65268 Transcript_23542/m.65268 type:complete len:580 (+) Transcript_23542:416-2155(+)
MSKLSHSRAHHLSTAVSTPGSWGEDNLSEELDAVMSGKVPSAVAKPEVDDVGDSLVSVLHLGNPEGQGPKDMFEAQLTHALEIAEKEVKGMGEYLVEVGGGEHCFGPSLPLDQAMLDQVMERISAAAAKWDAASTVIRSHEEVGRCRADILMRQRPTSRQPLEVRVAVIGNVDSGKSTLVGVLTRSILDDGRGLARSKVFKHGHEESTGRTSCVGQHNLCLDEHGEILNNPMFRATNCGEYVAKSCKVVTLVDLAGHERYFRTTAYGLTGHMPDYACMVVGANAGLIGMCKEHLGVALALKVPTFFVITKCDDICPEHVLKDTLKRLAAVMKKPGIKKRPFVIRTVQDAVTCARNIQSANLAPIFLTSAVTGRGLELLRCFFNLMPQRQRWMERASEAAEFIIDETFGVPGVGTVVAGTLKKGVIKTNSTLMLGPDIGDGSFHPSSVKSIHYKRMPVTQVVAGQTAALALKKVKRSSVRKGMVLVDASLRPVASWEFDADIAILTHATTIQPRYQAVIHCEIIRQAARVVAMDNERLRSGDRAVVRFRFLQRPEYITPGARFVFREGRTKGIGVVTAAY